MNYQSEAQTIEAFHLVFLRVLGAKRPDWYTLKGGANLRYFFGSERYSNDIDFDFHGREGWMATEAVSEILSGPALTLSTRHVGLRVVDITAPKQTSTTLRWKIGLVSDRFPDPVRTKVEFSSRERDATDVMTEAVPTRIVGRYGVMTSSVQHYGIRSATEQKIAALALRSETKARDIFDLELLFRILKSSKLGTTQLATSHAEEAAEKALQISYNNFRSEVLPFLDVEVGELYDSAESWTLMRDAVIESLLSLRTTE